jgi:hypothetical protein
VASEFQRSENTIETSTTAQASANISRVGSKGKHPPPDRAGAQVADSWVCILAKSIHPLSRGVSIQTGIAK